MSARGGLGLSSSHKICLPAGFSFSAACAGIKASGRPDLALVEASAGTTAAAVFTRNRIVAAPLEVGRAALAGTRGKIRALIVNSGNANCATGKAGIRDCQQVSRQLAGLLKLRPNQIFPSSTGIIGVPLPVEKIVAKLPELTAARQPTKQGIADFARAIMTTDTRPKLASATFHSGKTAVNLLGIAKGAGMIHPQLATMLVYLFTDGAASPTELKRLLRDSCEQTFNCISIDGDTSTNDTVLLLASGRSGVRLDQPSVRGRFSEALLQVCESLAEQIISDGEGVAARNSSLRRARKESSRGQAGGPNRGPVVVGKDRMGGRRSKLGTHSRRRRKIGNRHRPGQSHYQDRRSNRMPGRRRMRL